MRRELWLDFLCVVQPPFATVDDVIPEMEAVNDISYVDDASAYTWSPDPQTVIDNVKSIVAIYHEELLRHGMQLNYAAGKSECLVALRGKGATAVRERVFVCNKAKITVESQTGTLLLRVVDAYKHLGGIVTSSGSQKPRIASEDQSHEWWCCCSEPSSCGQT